MMYKVSKQVFRRFKMFKLIVFTSVLSAALFANDCTYLYGKRGDSLDSANKAIACYEAMTTDSKLLESKKLNQISYLKFFVATYFEDDSLQNLRDAYNTAKDSIEQYSRIFDSTAARNLEVIEKQEVALSYYLYGTAVSKYVDLKGKWEAIKRMSEIKNSMTTILKMKEAQTFHFGAYRTLAIFNLKVPSIAGGDLNKSKLFFERLMKESKNELGISSYPVGHYYYAEYLYRVSKKDEACSELFLLKNLSDKDIENFFPTLIFETKKDRADAAKKIEKYNC